MNAANVPHWIYWLAGIIGDVVLVYFCLKIFAIAKKVRSNKPDQTPSE